jgi:hypothetical protein
MNSAYFLKVLIFGIGEKFVYSVGVFIGWVIPTQEGFSEIFLPPPRFFLVPDCYR